MRIRIPDEEREISDAVAELMSAKLTEAQARRTLELAKGSIEIAVQIVNFYNSVPRHQRCLRLGGYDVYLRNLSEGFVYVEERHSGGVNLLEDEIAQMGLAVPQGELYQKHHRDDPRDSGHFYEHAASQDR